MYQDRLGQLVPVMAGALLTILTAGCTDERLRKPNEVPVVEPDPGSERAIRVLVTPAGQSSRWVKIAPVEWGSWTPGVPRRVPNADGVSPESGEDPELSTGPTRETLATIQQGGENTDTNERDIANGYASGWTLLHWAARSCLDADLKTSPSLHVDEAPWFDFSATPHPPSFHILHTHGDGIGIDVPGVNCDEALFFQEVLVCAADRLAQIGDSPGTTTWVARSPFGETFQSDEVVITVPPQSTDDLFIARDMALNVLAHVVRLDTQMRGFYTTMDPFFRASCTEQYGFLARTGHLGDEGSQQDRPYVFAPATKFIDPEDFDWETEQSVSVLKAAGRRRLERKAGVLASAARLTQDIVERSIRDDISGAQKQRSAAADALRGARAAWGVDEAQSPYNTLRHALRVLFGRLEIGNHRDADYVLFAASSPQFQFKGDEFVWEPHDGPTRDDPKCWAADGGPLIDRIITDTNLSALDLIGALPAGSSARWSDIQPKTPGESLALSILDQAGVVVPPAAIELLADDLEPLRQAVGQQLMVDAAQRAGASTIPEIEAFIDSDHGQALLQVLESVKTSELRFALDRVFDAFRLLAKVDDIAGASAAEITNNLSAAAGAAGLQLRTPFTGSAGPELGDIGAVLLDRGVPRRDLSMDVMANMRDVQSASQCGMFAEDPPAVALPPFPPFPDYHLSPYGADVPLFQNAFFLGDTLRRQLGLVAVEAQGTDLSAVKTFAQQSGAEIREWAGPGTIVRGVDDVAGKIKIHLLNIRPSDLGVQTNDHIKNRLILVADDIIAAESLAGIRESRPATLPDPETDMTGFTLKAESIAEEMSTRPGLDRPILTLTYPDSSLSSLRFAVMLPENGSPGRVLAALRRPEFEGVYHTEIVSNRQSELANQVFGVADSEITTRTCTNIAPLALPREYCVEGMQRDQFVPLANEITTAGTNTEDSWRHYLDLAEQASAKADELGNAMIEIGREFDVRKEAAAEAVGELCGAFGTVDNTTVENGVLSPAQGDDQLEQCIGGETIDIVFLRGDPFVDPKTGKPTADEETAHAQLWGAFCDNMLVPSKPPFCARKSATCTAGTGDCISHDGLNFSSSTVSPPSGDMDDACGALADALVPRDDLANQPNAFNAVSYGLAVNQSWATLAGLVTALGSLKLEIRHDGQWVLLLGSRPITGSDSVVQEYLGASSGSYGVPDVWPLCEHADPPVTCSSLGELLKELFPNPQAGDFVYPKIRAEVERSLFYLGAFAGGIPSDRIEMPLPAANRAYATGAVAAPALYGAGNFTESAPGEFVFNNNGYLGEIEPGPGQATLVGAARPFDLGYAQARKAASAAWRETLWTQVEAGLQNEPNSFVAVTAFNAPILFDNDLIPGVLDRTLLPTWLSTLGQQYDPEGTEVLEQLQIASFYTPGVFCGPGGKYKSGRDVCTGAFVSPVFHTTYDNWATEECDWETFQVDAPLPEQNLVATVGAFTKPNVSSQNLHMSMYSVAGKTMDPIESCTAPCGCPVCPYFQNFVWDGTGDGCGPGDVHWNIGSSCAHYEWLTEPWPANEAHFVSHERLLPSQCPPSERLEMFLETDLADEAHAMETIVRSLALSCISQNAAGVAPPPLPPPITSTEDIRQLEAWLNLVGYGIDKVASFYYLVDLPGEVVNIAKEGTSNVGAVTAGERGKLLLELEQQLRLVENGFASTGTALQQIGTEIQKTRLEIEGAAIENRIRKLNLAAAKIENDRQRSIALVQGAAAIVKLGTIAAVSFVEGIQGNALQPALEAINAAEQATMAGFTLDALEKQNDNIAAQAETSDDLAENQEALAVVTLSEAVAGLFQALRDNLTGIKNNVSASLQTVAALHQNESRARQALAKAAGADFVEINGKDVPLHVNTVYRRQFDILKLRYERALASAKRAAYLARLSVEQRLGVRLDDLHQSLGPLEPPASWVDDLCTVQGVDYDKLREALSPAQQGDGSEELDLIEGFADQFVGDYVAKLREFIEFYNLQFPFRESDDVAIISLREDLAASLTSCVAPSKNLLYYSDQLDSQSPDWALPEVVARNGWSFTGCDEIACLELRDGLSVQNPMGMSSVPVAAPDGNGNVSWLTTVARVTSAQDVWQHASPPGMVFQTVSLRAGTRYALSWWDMARAAGGGPTSMGATVRTYRAAVFDASWNLVSGDTFTPAQSTDGTTWSERRSLEIIAAADGDYHVAFSAALPGIVGANLAIANVQLEEAFGNVGEPTAYEQTTSTRVRSSGNCPADTPEQFRSRFLHTCDRQACWFELKDLLAVDTELLNQGRSALAGQIAQGNFNYRNGDVAVNVVGTGVLDCKDGSPSCFGSGYVEYDLQHTAFSIPLEDYESNVRCFDFGIGNIRSGKALAAERYITLPMSSADRDMIAQSPFLKPEFTGRPLSGSYRLRIKDSPSLAWDKVEDVQVVLNYRYWSRVDHSFAGN